MEKGFTLIELLVVVLITGILSVIALPQYQKAVEKTRTVEAIVILRAIADANRRYYLANGVWAKPSELNLLDINIPGIQNDTFSAGRIQLHDFVYAPSGEVDAGTEIARANRLSPRGWDGYRLYITPDGVLKCAPGNDYSSMSSNQQKLCNDINKNGTL